MKLEIEVMFCKPVCVCQIGCVVNPFEPAVRCIQNLQQLVPLHFNDEFSMNICSYMYQGVNISFDND